MNKKLILLIEDNEYMQDNIAEILELYGYNVQTADNGKIGIEKALSQPPDLVVCDIAMPELDGFGVLQIFKNNPQLAEIPFIFLTAKSERASFRKGMELGADDYITKPFEEGELLSAVESRFNRINQLKGTNNTPDQASSAKQVNDFRSLTVDRKIHLVHKKQYIYMDGEEPRRTYYIKSGKVKTVLFNPDGKEYITELYQPGDFFGYISPNDHSTYHDSAIALTDTELMYIPSVDFWEVLMNNHELNEKYIKQLAVRVERREQQLLLMAYTSLRRRIAHTLLDLQRQQPNANIKFTRDDLAAMVGTANESLIRILSEFKNDKLIEMTASGGITILDREKLQTAKW